MVVPGLTVRAAPKSLPGRAEQHQRRRTAVDIHGHGPAPAGTDDDIRAVPVELGLGDANGGVEIVVGQGRVQDFVAVVLEIGRLHAARRRLPAVEEEDFHGAMYPSFLAWAKSWSAFATSPFLL